MESTLKKKIISSFKLQGLSLKSAASSYLVDVLIPYTYSTDLNDILDKILEAIQQQPLKTAILSRDVVEKAVDECNEASDSDSERALVVIDAFSIPAFEYNSDKRKFFPRDAGTVLFGSANDKSSLWKERYSIVRQATLRHELFAPPAVEGMNAGSRFELKTVEFLLSTSGSSKKVLVLGMLVQIKEGKYHLEDPTGVVEVSLANSQFQIGLFVENSLVLAEGVFDENIFHATAVGFPPSEPSARSRLHLGNVNFFGGPHKTGAKSSVKLQAMERQHSGAMFVFLAEVHLDNEQVMTRLNLLFKGYSSVPPMAFILMGNFSSAPHGNYRNSDLANHFQMLANIITKYPSLLSKSQFIFVPGPSDPGPGNLLPRPPIPATVTRSLSETVPSAVFCSNPCRLQFCTQEIVIFREDLMSKMCRNYVKFPSSSFDMTQHLAKTLTSQFHLCPLPLHVQPIYWQYDHSLRLYPLPDLIVLGDSSKPFTGTELECQITNTGSFATNGGEFKVYMAGTKLIDDSVVLLPTSVK